MLRIRPTNKQYVKTFEQFVFEAESNTVSSAIQTVENAISQKGFFSIKKSQFGDISKDEIKSLHSILNRLGYSVGEEEESGVYGQKTMKAVKDFQTNAKDADIQDPDGYVLTPDGLFGEKSLNVARMILEDDSLKQDLDKQKGNSTSYTEETPNAPKESFESFEDIKKLPGTTTEQAGSAAGGWHVTKGQFKGFNFYSNNRYGNDKSEKGTYSFENGKIVLKKDGTPGGTQPIAGDFEFKNSNNDLVKFSDLKRATNKWFENKDTVAALIKNNRADAKFIKEFSSLYNDRSKRTLIDFMTNEYSESLTGGRAFEIGLELFDIILTHIINPTEDAKVIHFAVDGAGTEDALLKKVIEKRANSTPQYKAKIASEYEMNFGESLIDALEGDLDTDNSRDVALIKKIVPDYFG